MTTEGPKYGKIKVGQVVLFYDHTNGCNINNINNDIIMTLFKSVFHVFLRVLMSIVR